MPVQPRTPQGVLELLPAEQIAFQRMLDTIRRNFELFGFLPSSSPRAALIAANTRSATSKRRAAPTRLASLAVSAGELDTSSG